MTLTRRHFLGSSAMTLAAVAATTAVTARPATAHACTSLPRPTFSVQVLNRMGYGPRPGDIAAFEALGGSADARLQAYVEQQLNPAAIDDSACDARLAAMRLALRYDGFNEAPGLDHLNKTTPELWPLYRGDVDWAWRIRPAEEVRVATWVRAVYSRRQLFEVMTDFWHNHFNINAYSDAAISATFPVYDREVIRKNVFGNFRNFLVDVAQSTAMMYYLDNMSNRAGGGEGGNENFARELFELHGLGSDNYLKFYDKRVNIGTIAYNGETFVRGYIDDDVYDASYCFTGWTIKNGHRERPTLDDGTFYFDPAWHQPGNKLVLVRTFDDIIEDRADPVQEGMEVIRRIADHPGTARFLCTKLCRRFISDDPPAAVIDAATATWMAHRESPDQIAQVLRTILLSREFKTTWGEKAKRPLEAIWSFIRASEAELPIDDTSENGNRWTRLFWRVDRSGQRLFNWPTPTGHPDLASFWSNTNTLLTLWNMPFAITQAWGGSMTYPVLEITDLSASCVEIVNFWVQRILNMAVSDETRAALIRFLAQGGDPNLPPQPTPQAPDWRDIKGVHDRVFSLVQLVAASPEFYAR